MLVTEIEGHWQTVKESYPDAIVFHEVEGIYVVIGKDGAVLDKEFGVGSNGKWCGFDSGLAYGYMAELAERGYSVVRATSSSACHIKPAADRKREMQRQRKKAQSVALEPQLLFDQREIECATNDRWLEARAYQRLFAQFQQWLKEGDWRSLAGFGELYVYQVGDWYELETDLTSMLESHVLVLAKAALATRSKLSCKLVEPKCRRERRPGRVSNLPVASVEPRPLGQLGFGSLSSVW